jgi:hypothetical protein
MEGRQHDELACGKLGVTAAPTGTARCRYELDPHPAATLALGVVRGRREPVARMEVARDQVARTQQGVRGPTVSVEDPHAVPENAPGRVDADLPGKVGHDPDVVIAEDEVHRDPLFEQAREEPEHDGSERRRRADDGMFCVAGDQHRIGARGADERHKVVREAARRPLGRTFRASPGPTEAEVDVGHDERAGPPSILRL